MEEKENFSGDEIMKMATAIYNKHFKCCPKLREDLILEGILGIVTAINKFQKDKGVRLSTYAWKTGKGMMMEYLKKERERIESFTILPHCNWAGDDDYNFKEIIYNRETIGELHRIIEKFNERDKFITYKMMEGYTRAEIARILNTSSQSVWLTWKRIRARIIREYNGEGKTEGVNGR